MVESFKKNRTGILLMLVSSLFACTGQLFWKLSSYQSLAEYSLIILFIGFSLYGVGALFMLIAYRHGSLSVLQPILSMNYVLTIILSVTVLRETMTLLKVIGILVIMLGVVLIGGGDD